MQLFTLLFFCKNGVFLVPASNILKLDLKLWLLAKYPTLIKLVHMKSQPRYSYKVHGCLYVCKTAFKDLKRLGRATAKQTTVILHKIDLISTVVLPSLNSLGLIGKSINQLPHVFSRLFGNLFEFCTHVLHVTAIQREGRRKEPCEVPLPIC